MTGASRDFSKLKEGSGAVMRHIGIRSTRKRHSGLLVIFIPVILRGVIVFRSIYGSDKISQAAIIRAFVFVERPLSVVVRSFVHDIVQNSSVGNLCGVAGWDRFTKSGDIPIKLQGDCNL